MQSYQDIEIENIIKIDENNRLEICQDHVVLFNFVQKNRKLFSDTMKWVENFNTLEDSKSFIGAWNEEYQKRTKLCYFIMHNQELAGFFCFRILDFATKSAEIGYMMDMDYSGKGILRKCIKFMLDYALDKYQTQRFTLVTGSNNLRSQNVGLKLGFKLFKRDENSFVVNGVTQDLLTFELTKEDYLQFQKVEKSLQKQNS